MPFIFWLIIPEAIWHFLFFLSTLIYTKSKYSNFDTLLSLFRAPSGLIVLDVKFDFLFIFTFINFVYLFRLFVTLKIEFVTFSRSKFHLFYQVIRFESNLINFYHFQLFSLIIQATFAFVFAIVKIYKFII